MEEFWRACLERLQGELSSQQYNLWIRPLSFDAASQPARILAPNRFVLQWVKDKFMPSFETWAEEHFRRPTPILLALAEHVAPSPSVANPPGQTPVVAAPAQDNRDAASRLNPAFTFDSYVPGRANQLARAAALQIAENPGSSYNPLFVYGGVGLGKTHLIQAIGNHLRTQNPAARISYIHAETYVSDVVRAYQHRAFDDFKRRYHTLDLLLIDDIQFFARKNRTQEEFFYAFNALIEARKQVVISADSFPKDIQGMEDRLKSRFGWGLTVRIDPPELEMRVAILLKKAETENIDLHQNVAFFIANHVRSNIRELEGALKRVIAYSTFSGDPVTVDLARESLRDLIVAHSRQISIENIQKTTADFYKLKVSDMFSPRRTRAVARPRQIAMALAKELTQKSLPEIGESFGGRDHTTVLHACRKVTELRLEDPAIARDYNLLMETLTS
jgi:chromosomal replication initiator protein